jgi:hypothetical protein
MATTTRNRVKVEIAIDDGGVARATLDQIYGKLQKERESWRSIYDGVDSLIRKRKELSIASNADDTALWLEKGIKNVREYDAELDDLIVHLRRVREEERLNNEAAGRRGMNSRLRVSYPDLDEGTFHGQMPFTEPDYWLKRGMNSRLRLSYPNLDEGAYHGQMPNADPDAARRIFDSSLANSSSSPTRIGDVADRNAQYIRTVMEKNKRDNDRGLAEALANTRQSHSDDTKNGSEVIRRITSDAQKGSEATAKMTGHVAELRQTLISLSGVPYPEAMNQVSKLFGLSMAGTVAIGALAAIAGFAIQKSEEMKQEALKKLKEIESAANTGVMGGADTRRKDLEQMKRDLREIQDMHAFGDNNQAKEVELLKKNGVRNEVELAAAIQGAEVRLDSFLEKKRDQLRVEERLIEFDRERVRNAKEFAAVDRRQRGLDDEKKAYGFSDLKSPYEKLQDARDKDWSDFKQKSDASVNQTRTALASTNRLYQETLSEILRMQSQIGGDPYVDLFVKAGDKMDAFKEKAKELPASIYEAYKQANTQILSLDVFKAELAQSGRIAKLLSDANDVDRNREYDRNRLKSQQDSIDRQNKYEDELALLTSGRLNYERPGQRLQDRIALIKKSLSDSGGANDLSAAIEEATRGLSVETLRQYGLLGDRESALGRLSRGERVNRLRIDPATALAHQLVDQANLLPAVGIDGKPLEGAALLAAQDARRKMILDATGDVSKLDASLRGERQQALREQAARELEQLKAVQLQTGALVANTAKLDTLIDKLGIATLVEVTNSSDRATVSNNRLGSALPAGGGLAGGG